MQILITPLINGIVMVKIRLKIIWMGHLVVFIRLRSIKRQYTSRTNQKHVVSKNGETCDDFKIIYICGRPGKANHTRKVDEYPDVRHISYDDIKLKMFGLSLFPSK